ncbi:MAG: hypothetical protein M1830_009090 [Pleopsidium flavum]|nr:MAG: hypothetical protein M1830_009090 [Pleopsidium flavum]
MAGQKSARPSKRHLVRWTDDMDKKLLLTIQSVCNAEGVKVPWDKVGKIMGDKISDGAVIQHLAKLRQRMVSQGLSVPPPLRRGGGGLISTGYSGGSSIARSNNQSGAITGPVQRTVGKDEEEFDVDKATDMEEDYGQARSKRTKRGKKKEDTAWKAAGELKGKNEIKTEDSDEDLDSSAEQKGAQMEDSRKRKRNIKQTGIGKGKGLPQQKGFQSGIRARRSSVDYAELNGGYDSNDDYDSGEGEEYVGAGAPYMEFAVSEEDEDKIDEQPGPQSKSATPSKVVVLQVGKLNQTPRSLQGSGATLKSGSSSESGDESEIATDPDRSTDLNQPVGPQPGPGPGALLGATYANPNVSVYYQQETFPTFREVSHVGHGSRLSGYPYGYTTFDNHDWLDGAQYLHRSFAGNAVPSSYSHPPTPLTGVTIPQQANVPNVELNPPSATSTYSDNTPVLMSDKYYSGLGEGMGGTDNFNQAYHEPTPPDPTLGPDGGFDFLNFL